MGKRSSFERIPRDFYPTPFAAVPPLIPHLRGVRTFAEPCCNAPIGLRAEALSCDASTKQKNERKAWRRNA